MKKLTPKQETFCLEYIKTGNASEAYRRAYSAGKMKPETINRNANTLMGDSKIAARMDELRAPAIKAAQITYEGHLRELEELRQLAKEAGQYSAAIKAEENRGKAAGFYKERLEHSGPGGQPLPSAVTITLVKQDGR